MSHPDDEFLSALLDGEVPPGDVAHVDGCDDCQTRLGELRGASTLIASAVSLPPAHLREAALATALRSLDEPASIAPAPRRMNALSAAAVLLVALAVGGLLITQLGRSPDRTANTSDSGSLAQALGSTTVGRADKSAAADDASSTLAAPSAEMSAAGTAGGGTAGAYNAGELGSVSAIDELIRRASADLDHPDTDRFDHTVDEPSPCPVDVAGTALWQATLTFNGEAAVAEAVETENGRVMRILRRADCSLLASQSF